MLPIMEEEKDKPNPIESINIKKKCWGCEIEKEENSFSPSQWNPKLEKHKKYHYCKKCLDFVRKHGHYPKTMEKYDKEKNTYTTY